MCGRGRALLISRMAAMQPAVPGPRGAMLACGQPCRVEPTRNVHMLVVSNWWGLLADDVDCSTFCAR